MGVLGVLFGEPGVLVGVLGVWWFVWRTLHICWRNWCLWHWDVVFVTFRIWDDASNIFIIGILREIFLPHRDSS